MRENSETKIDVNELIGGSWLIRGEIEAGYEIVRPGEVAWLPLEDWDGNTIISQGRFRVRLVALMARDPGHGALKRLIAAIQNQGRMPVVVEPFNDLAVVLRRWGWKRRHIGRGGYRHCIWHPRTPWPDRPNNLGMDILT